MPFLAFVFGFIFYLQASLFFGGLFETPYSVHVWCLFLRVQHIISSSVLTSSGLLKRSVISFPFVHFFSLLLLRCLSFLC